MYLGFCFYSDMMKSTNQEMNAIVKILYYLQFPRGRGHATPCRATLENTEVGYRQREQGGFWKSLYSVFSGKEWARPSKQANQV